jgi:HAD superfamily hydrolase (TIGR01509 family)
VTGGKERILRYLSRYHPDFQPSQELGAFIASLHAAKTAHYTRMLSEGAIPLRSGVERLLRQAREAGLRLAIATTTTPANVVALLKYSLASEAAEWFDVIAAGDIVPAKKPAPDIYLWTLQKLALPPSACFAVEDSHNGVQSAWRAGIRSILVTTNDYTAEDDFAGASLVVDGMGDPREPFALREGRADGHGFVSLELLREVHGRSLQ